MTFMEGRPPAAWLAMCFGLCLPTAYTAVPSKELDEQQPRRAPRSDWRDMPLVSNFKLITQIGKGSFSEIWLAERLVGRERVALKVVNLGNPDLEAEEVGTLLAEAKFLRSLNCPYLLTCYETAATQDWLVLVLEHLSGGEIMDHLHKVKKYTEAVAAKLFAQVVSGVSYLHNLNFMHRDIKPENVMFTRPVEECEAQGQALRVKVIDLGFAALYDPQKSIRGCIGTPGFVSPELWNDGPHTPACDIYALGVVLFIMLTGRKPHSGRDIRLMTYCNKSIHEAPGLQDERFLSLSSSARELLLAMLADDPRDRPSCAEVLRHPFITAVDTNAEVHREIEASVRRRMRELAQLRRVHGLRYALRAQKSEGVDHLAFLQLLDQRRAKLKREGFTQAADGSSQVDGGGCSGFGRTSVDAPGGPALARCSLSVSFTTTPPALSAFPDRRQSVHEVNDADANAICSVPGVVATAADATAGSADHSPHHSKPPPPLQLVLKPLRESELSSSVSAPAAEATDNSRGGTHATAWPPLGPSTDTQDAPQSRDMSVKGADDQGGLGGVGGAAGCSNRQQLVIDPMAVVNALPKLQHRTSADALTLGARIAAAWRGCDGNGDGAGDGDGGGDGERPADGASPVLSAALVEQVFTRCMSANPDTLELMRHQESLRLALDQLALPVLPETKDRLKTSVTGYQTATPLLPPALPDEAVELDRAAVLGGDVQGPGIPRVGGA